MTTFIRFEPNAHLPEWTDCAGYDCHKKAVWIHHFPNGGATYLCQKCKCESEKHYPSE